MKVEEKVAIAFIKWHFPNAAYIFNDTPYDAFRALVSKGMTIAAAEEYHKLNNNTIAEAHFAVLLASELGFGDA